MATITQRVKSIADAITNSNASNALITRMVEGNTGWTSAENSAATVDEKGARFMLRLRKYLIANVKEYEKVAPLNAAAATVESSVDTAFSEV